MSDNQKIRRRLRCPNCGSLGVIKWGIRNGIQRHKGQDGSLEHMKAVLCSPPVRFFAGEEHAKLVFS